MNPAGDTKKGFGNVPFARDEFTADRLVLHVNLDLAQIRGYGLGPEAEELLVLLALHRVRKLIDGDLRLRTACDLEPATRAPKATRPEGFSLPTLSEIEADLHVAIGKNKSKMVHTETSYDAKIESAKKRQIEDAENGGDDENDGED